MKDLNSGFCDLQTCGETDRLLKAPVESIRVNLSRFCKLSCAFVDYLAPGSCGPPSSKSDRLLRVQVESSKFDLNRH